MTMMMMTPMTMMILSWFTRRERLHLVRPLPCEALAVLGQKPFCPGQLFLVALYICIREYLGSSSAINQV